MKLEAGAAAAGTGASRGRGSKRKPSAAPPSDALQSPGSIKAELDSLGGERKPQDNFPNALALFLKCAVDMRSASGQTA